MLADEAKTFRASDPIREDLPCLRIILDDRYRDAHDGFIINISAHALLPSILMTIAVHDIAIRTGTTKTIVVPLPGADLISQSPPISSSRSRMLARPLPEPVRAGSKDERCHPFTSN